MAGGGRPGSPHQFFPQDSKPSVPKVLAKYGGLQLQTASDRSSGRGFSHVEPAAKQLAARCFSAGETIHSNKTSLLTPLTRQLPCLLYRPPRTVNTCHKTAPTERIMSSCPTAQRNSASSKRRLSKIESKTHFSVFTREFPDS